MTRCLRAALLATALFATSSVLPAHAADDVTLILNWYLGGLHAPFYLGKERGFYEEEDINLTIQEGRGSAVAAQVVAAGDVDFGMSDAGSLMLAAAKGLPIEAVMSLLHGHEPVLLGEGVELFSVPVPSALAGKTLGMSGIGSRTGMSVVAIQRNGDLITPLTIETTLAAGTDLLMLGSLEQRKTFADAFEQHRGH